LTGDNLRMTEKFKKHRHFPEEGLKTSRGISRWRGKKQVGQVVGRSGEEEEEQENKKISA